ncbi:MAG: DUF1549 domain-containing protein [Planctomycetales bacterium]|nr:DUF1549 domain-containing protein [Planctomycetales bacterium]
MALFLNQRRLWIAILTVLTLASPLHAQRKRQKLPSQKFKGYGLPEAVKQAPKSAPQVSPVDAGRLDECRTMAAAIDRLVEKNLAKHGMQPNEMANDYHFVRRAFLDCVGTIPTLQQTVAFEAMQDETKQEKLVDDLLNSYGYVSHMYNFWASILRVTDRPSNNLLAYSYRDWLKDQLRTNRPYDQWVYEMLTAEGKVWDNPAVGYTMRDDGMPLVHVDNTVRVFLGTQIGCAQCHDHPFDKWTQKEFYELAAFTNGVRTRDGAGTPAFAEGNPINRLRQELQADDPEARLQGIPNLLAQANLYRVSFNESKKLKLPDDYQYDNGKPKQVVKPQILWGEIPVEAKKLSSREQYASWLTSAENPLFAKTIANRLWKKVMGVGLIEPIDNIQDDSPCENVELLQLLSDEIVRLKFDQKEFMRTLMFTKTYQRAASNFDPSQSEFYHFPGPKLRRMTAEQVWDSILTIAIYNPYPFELPAVDQFAKIADVDLAKISVEQLEQQSEQFNETVGPNARTKIMGVASYRRQVLARASELPSPLPADHFIRQFGQCDRETIEGDSFDPTVPQMLTMFNGPFTHMMLENGSVIYDNLARAGAPKDAVNVMFLSILNRLPSASDRSTALKELSHSDTAMAYGNLVWALINTREFLFVQ